MTADPSPYFPSFPKPSDEMRFEGGRGKGECEPFKRAVRLGEGQSANR